MVNAPLTYSDVQVKRDIANLKAAAAKAKVAGAFLPVVAPASALPNAKNEHYPDEKSLLWALAGIAVGLLWPAFASKPAGRTASS